MFDFDYHEKGAEITDFANVTEEWHDEVDALRLICESNGIAPLVERSRDVYKRQRQMITPPVFPCRKVKKDCLMSIY